MFDTEEVIDGHGTCGSRIYWSCRFHSSADARHHSNTKHPTFVQAFDVICSDLSFIILLAMSFDDV